MSYVSSDARVVAAIIAGKSPEMDRGARRVLQSVRGVAAQHHLTGAYERALHIVTVPGELGTGRLVDDRLIVADDPGSASIEWGHFTKFVISDGSQSRTERAGDRRRVSTGRFVAGMHPMLRGMAAA